MNFFVFLLPQIFAPKQAFENLEIQNRVSGLFSPTGSPPGRGAKGYQRPGWILVEVRADVQVLFS